jgi:hypothetical protein
LPASIITARKTGGDEKLAFENEVEDIVFNRIVFNHRGQRVVGATKQEIEDHARRQKLLLTLEGRESDLALREKKLKEWEEWSEVDPDRETARAAP